MTPAPPALTYYPDSEPGIRRQRRGRGFSYIAPDGTRISRGAERARIEALAVPPAYEDVWICPRADGHLQATGRDTRARKQYRYHPDFRAWRETRKYADLPDFGAALPRLRRAILRDLRRDAGDRAFAIAACLALLDRAAIRVGTETYAEENGSFGASTLLNRHLDLDRGRVSLCFTGKGGRRIQTQLSDRTLARTLHKLQDLPGGRLLTWLDGSEPRTITSSDVAERMAEITSDTRFTPKTFRTWAGSEAALSAALDAGEGLTIKTMAEAAADRLKNTPAIARASYIHPAVIALADSEDPGWREALVGADGPAELRQAERALLALLAGSS